MIDSLPHPASSATPSPIIAEVVRRSLESAGGRQIRDVRHSRCLLPGSLPEAGKGRNSVLIDVLGVVLLRNPDLDWPALKAHALELDQGPELGFMCDVLGGIHEHPLSVVYRARAREFQPRPGKPRFFPAWPDVGVYGRKLAESRRTDLMRSWNLLSPTTDGSEGLPAKDITKALTAAVAEAIRDRGLVPFAEYPMPYPGHLKGLIDVAGLHPDYGCLMLAVEVDLKFVNRSIAKLEGAARLGADVYWFRWGGAFKSREPDRTPPPIRYVQFPLLCAHAGLTKDERAALRTRRRIERANREWARPTPAAGQVFGL